MRNYERHQAPGIRHQRARQTTPVARHTVPPTVRMDSVFVFLSRIKNTVAQRPAVLRYRVIIFAKVQQLRISGCRDTMIDLKRNDPKPIWFGIT